MQALVIYGSQFGNTQKIAEAIAAALGARIVPASAVARKDVAEADLIVVGAPTQAHGIHPPTRDALAAWADAVGGKPFAAFDTRFRGKAWLTGSAAKGIDRRLREAGGSQVAPPESFFVAKSEGPLVEGELTRAAAWARTLLAAAPEAAR